MRTGVRFDNEVLRVADLAITTHVLEGFQFFNCQLLGPAVFIPMGETLMQGCNFESELDDLFWLVPPERAMIVGGLGIRDCLFIGCNFTRIGWAGPQELYNEMKASIRWQ